LTPELARAPAAVEAASVAAESDPEPRRRTVKGTVTSPPGPEAIAAGGAGCAPPVRLAAARGHRLDIASGTAVRFEPGQSRTVGLIALAGDRMIYGFRQLVMGPLDAAPVNKARVSKKKKV
jgi:hypothetical protein